MNHFRRIVRIRDVELALFGAFVKNSRDHFALRGNAGFAESRPSLGNDAGDVQRMGFLVEFSIGRAQFGKKIIAQFLARAAPRRRGDLIEIGKAQSIVFAGDGLGNVELARKKTVDIARRHTAFGGDIGHGGLRISVMGKEFARRAEDVPGNDVLIVSQWPFPPASQLRRSQALFFPAINLLPPRGIKYSTKRSIIQMSENPFPSAEPYSNISVIGAGAWGTALAAMAAAEGRPVRLWAREPDVVQSIIERRVNERYLPDVVLPSSVEAASDLRYCCHVDAILLAAPAQHLRATLENMRAHLNAKIPIVLCAKGLETASGKLITEILAETISEAEAAILSGPSFAKDAARGLPTLVVIGAREDIAARLQATLGASPSFRPYVTSDVTGVALGGAAKNVYAIACGMVDGAKLGESARAGLLARSFAELLRLGAAMGARSETLMGLSGLGDLVLTATSKSSRNFAFGAAFGAGKPLKELLAPGMPLAEGTATAPALLARGRRHDVELPIAEAVADMLAGKLDLEGAAERLLSRPLRAE